MIGFRKKRTENVDTGHESMSESIIHASSEHSISGTKTTPWICLFFVIFLYFLVPGINHGLWSPDEPRVAATSMEMARDHDYVVPKLTGKPFLEKPPLYYAAGAVAGSVMGLDTDVPYRLVSLLFGLLTLVVTFLMVSRTGGAIRGIMAAGILASCWEFFMLARWIQVDIALVFGVTLGMYAYLCMQDLYQLRYSIILGIATGIAFMAKGLVGPAVIAAAILTDIIRQRDIRIAWKIRPFTIALCAALAILPWTISLYQRGGWSFLREVLVVNNLMRFTGAPEGAALGHQESRLYYFLHFPGDSKPWFLLFIPAFIASIRNFRSDRYLSWFIGPFILFNIASTKRGIYLVPLYPAVACMIATWLHEARQAKWESVLVKILWALSIIACFVPLAGFFLGMPVVGATTCAVSICLLAVAYRMDMKPFKSLSLVMITCVAMFSASVLYYEYLKPSQDYLSFTRQAAAASEGTEIHLLEPEEITRGALYFATKKFPKEVASVKEVQAEGFYFWADRDNKILTALNARAKVQLLLEKDLEHISSKKSKMNGRVLRFAHVFPNP